MCSRRNKSTSLIRRKIIAVHTMFIPETLNVSNSLLLASSAQRGVSGSVKNPASLASLMSCGFSSGFRGAMHSKGIRIRVGQKFIAYRAYRAYKAYRAHMYNIELSCMWIVFVSWGEWDDKCQPVNVFALNQLELLRNVE